MRPELHAPPARRFNSFIVGPDTSFSTVVNLNDGSALWHQPLPAPIIQAGTAINRQGQVFVSLETGKILAFGAVD